MSEAPGTRPAESVGQRILRATFVVIFFQLFWKFGGFVITLLVGRLFGSGPESDAYFFVTETVVFLLQTLCLKIFIPLVVPIFKEQLGQHGEEAAQRFGITVLNLTILVLAVVTAAGLVFAPQVIRLFAQGFNDRQTALSVRLMRWMFPGVFAICLASVTYALLNSYSIFSYAAAGDAVQKTVWAALFLVAAVVGFSTQRLLDSLAVAFVISTVGMVLTHLLGLRSKLHFYRLGLPALSTLRVAKEGGILAAHVAVLGAGLWVCDRSRPWLPTDGAVTALQQVVLVAVVSAYLLLLWRRARGRTTPMAKFAALAVPLLFGILFAKYRDIVTNLFASFTGTGVFSDLKYARKVGEAPNTLIIAALSIAILPHLCELATQRKWDTFAHVMTRTIRGILAFFVPLAALIVVLRRPIIQLLFESGDWSDYHLSRAGDALGLYILSLPFFAIENPIQQSFFAMQRMWTPTLIGFLSTGFHILFLFIGIEWLGFGYFAVVATVYFVARAFKEIILLLVLRYHVRILPWRETGVFLAKALTATLGVIGASWGTHQLLTRFLPLEPFRLHEIMIDTFNVELRDWEGDNVDEFRIASKGDQALNDAFRGVLKDGESPVVGENALMAIYHRAPHRTAGLRRELIGLNLFTLDEIALDVSCTQPAELSLELVTRHRVSYYHAPIPIAAGGPQHIRVAMDSFHAQEALGEVVALWIRDLSRPRRVARATTTLVVDNLSLLRWDGQEVRLDTFEPATEEWRIAEDALGEQAPKPASVEDTHERAGEPELALHLPGHERRRHILCPLQIRDLRGCSALTFKARADRRCDLGVQLYLWVGGGPQTACYFSAPVTVGPGERRKSYSLPFSKLQPHYEADELNPSEIALLEFVVPDGVDFWLDNVAFVREPRGPRIGGISVFYEFLKLVHVVVPTAAAFVVFAALLLVLRVEEAKTAWDWLREKALKKVLAKIRR